MHNHFDHPIFLMDPKHLTSVTSVSAATTAISAVATTVSAATTAARIRIIH